MAYVGNTPADKTLKLEKQQFTTSATTTLTQAIQYQAQH
jgi:hypothetical protein